MTSEGTHKDRIDDDNDKHYTARIWYWFTRHGIVKEQRYAYYRSISTVHIYFWRTTSATFSFPVMQNNQQQTDRI